MRTNELTSCGISNISTLEMQGTNDSLIKRDSNIHSPVRHQPKEPILPTCTEPIKSETLFVQTARIYISTTTDTLSATANQIIQIC